MIGNTLFECLPESGGSTVVGFENHSGKTYLGKGKIVNICGFLTTGVSICTGLPPHTSFVYWNRSQRSVPL